MPTRTRTSGEDRLAAIHTQLVDAVEALVHSENWAAMLAVAARFPSYSPSNILLITLQRPDATRVAGIRTWNDLGRRVTKGEHGIAILAPCLYRRDADDAPPSDADRARPEADSSPETGRQLRGFKVVHVFDVTQTEGQPLPDAGPALLTGEAPEHLWDHLTGLVRDDGYALERGPCPPEVNGYTDFTGRIVRVRDDVDPAQAVKTLAHELGHIRADHATRFPDYAADRTCRGQAEIEAESIAYIVTTNAGMVADPYSVPYVAEWSGGEPGRIRECLSMVMASARTMAVEASQSGSDSRRTNHASSTHSEDLRRTRPEEATKQPEPAM
jgi:antirestriction protein ArdC